MPAGRTRYGAVAIGLHWVIAAAIAAQLVLGLVMVQGGLPLGQKFGLFQLHKSIGITVLLAVVLRVLWRLTHRPPPLPAFMPAGERRAASGAHLLLYALMLGLPLSGWALVSASVRNIPTLLYGTIPWPHLPVLPTLADKAPVEAALAWVHAWLAWSIIALLVLHIGGALRHALRRDGIFWRMAPFWTPEYMMRVAVLCACLLLPGVARAANWIADPAASKLEFTAMQEGRPFRGHFERFAARISFDPAQPQAGTADVTIDLGSAVTGDSERDGALPTAEWFDAKKSPQATFHAASFTARGGEAYVANGRLTIRGVGVDLALPFTLTITGDTAHAKGHADLLRSAFGVGQGQFANDQLVAFEVGVDVDLLARKAP